MKITEKIVFKQEVEAAKKTEKQPLKLKEVDLETGKALLECICFKDKACKKAHLDRLDIYNSDKATLVNEIKDFENKKKNLAPKWTKDNALRAQLYNEEKELKQRAKTFSKPMPITESEAMIGVFEVNISDTTTLKELVNQIDK